MNDEQSSNYLAEELVTQILLRLPIKPLFQYKSVSKKWKSFISDPKFARKYMKHAVSGPESSSLWQLWGLILNDDNFKLSESSSSSSTASSTASSSTASSTIHGNEIDNATPPSLYLLKGCTRSIEIVASSNGLMLYQRYTPDESQLWISNPLTKDSVELPFPPTYNLYNESIDYPRKLFLATRVGQLGGESSNPNPDPNPAYVSYKVVFIQRYTLQDKRKVYISTFGSDTGTWSDTTDAQVPQWVVLYSEPFASKGVLHWFDWKKKALITYDPYGSDPGRFGRFPLPDLGPNCSIFKRSTNLILLGNEDSIKIGEIEDCGNLLGLRLRIWLLLDSEKGDWCLWQTCVISSSWKASELTKCTIVAPFPWNEEIFCGFWEERDRIEARDVESGQDVAMDIVKPSGSYVPVALCPWSSPFYSNATRMPCLASEFMKISNVWFPISARYPVSTLYPRLL